MNNIFNSQLFGIQKFNQPEKFRKLFYFLYFFPFLKSPKKFDCYYNRMASRPGISGNLEKSRNFVALKKGQGMSQNLEKSGNFYMKLGKIRKFYLCETNIDKVFSRFIQVMNKNQSYLFIYHTCSCGFLSENKNEFKLWNSLFFFFLDQKVYCY